jgi:DNA primase
MSGMVDFIANQLNQLDKAEVGEKRAKILCPFHTDTNPSLLINLDESKPVGIFKCFSCGEGGNWNKLAEKLNLKSFDIDHQGEYYSARLRTKPTAEEFASEAVSKIRVAWDKRIVWRGISGKLVHELGGYVKPDPYGEDVQLVLPVFVRNNLMGEVSCAIERTSKKQLAYIFSRGSPWTLSSLYPYDLVKKRKPNVVFLTEGLRDCLNLIQHGVPALCNFGAKASWSEKCAWLTLSLGVDLVVLAFDSDAAGYECTRLVKPQLENLGLTVKAFDVKKHFGVKDPGDLNKQQILKIKKAVGL